MKRFVLIIFYGTFFFKGMAQNPVVKETPIIDYYNLEDPQYPGGKEMLCEYIVTHTQYPQLAVDSNITGKVFVRFIVEKDGHVDNVEILKGVHPLLDSAAVQVVRTLPEWKPAIRNGTPVRIMLNLPINFEITDSDKPGEKKGGVSQCKDWDKKGFTK